MEVQVTYLYNHNFERINTKLLSLGSNLNFSYGLVMRVVYLLKDLGLNKNDARKIKIKAWQYFEGNHEIKNITWNKNKGELYSGLKTSTDFYRLYNQTSPPTPLVGRGSAQALPQ